MSHVEHCIANHSGLRTSFAAPLCLAYHGASRARIAMSIEHRVMPAQDMQDSLEGSGVDLYIGTGKAMAPGAYFSGLIDDVRIYNRAVKP